MKFTLEQLQKTKVAQSAANQRLISEAIGKYGAKADVLSLGSIQPQKLQRDKVRALDDEPAAHQGNKSGVVICVTIIRFGWRELDEVNLVAGCKELQDSVARSLGVDDADPRVQWRFRQITETGRHGTLVKIDEI